MRFESAPAKWEKFNSGSLRLNGVRIARLDWWSVVAQPADAVGHLIRASAAALEGKPTPAAPVAAGGSGAGSEPKPAGAATHSSGLRPSSSEPDVVEMDVEPSTLYLQTKDVEKAQGRERRAGELGCRRNMLIAGFAARAAGGSGGAGWGARSL
jgi:hypothetical protein